MILFILFLKKNFFLCNTVQSILWLKAPSQSVWAWQCCEARGGSGSQTESINEWMNDIFCGFPNNLPTNDKKKYRWLLKIIVWWFNLKETQSSRPGKTNSMNSVEFNIIKIFRQICKFFRQNLDPWTCKLEVTSKMSSSWSVNDTKYVNTK